MSGFFALARIRSTAWASLRFLLVPLLFQAFLVVGALDPLLDAGSAVSAGGSLCALSLHHTDGAPSTPDPANLGFDHAHCPLCASLAFSLPALDLPLLPQGVQFSHRATVSMARAHVRHSPPFTHPPAQAPPICS